MRLYLYTTLLILCFGWSCTSNTSQDKLFPFESNNLLDSNLSPEEERDLKEAKGRVVPSISTFHLQNMIDYNKKGLTIFSFYNMDCTSCLETNLNIKKISTDLVNMPLQVVYVNLDSSLEKDKLNSYVRSNGMTDLIFQLQTKDKWWTELDLDWNQTLPALLLVNNSLEMKAFYEQEFDYGELYALVQPFL